MPAQPDFERRMQSIEGLLSKIDATADPAVRAMVKDLVQLVMDLHGAGIERMLELIRTTSEPGDAAVQKLGRDELVASLLILYGLHPVDLEKRVAEALEKARLRLRTHSSEVELLSVQDGVVRLRLHASGNGCGSTAQDLKEMVENAVYQYAPDITAIEIEMEKEKPGFVPLELLQSNGAGAHRSNVAVMAGEKGRP